MPVALVVQPSLRLDEVHPHQGAHVREVDRSDVRLIGRVDRHH
ncbi:hypothetical protein [Streptomyces sp. P17]|nr:hypothetical protein [Streptomyces sp. P17]MDT9698185.1 hypothetical protein [Streptomyces sp. P17]